VVTSSLRNQRAALRVGVCQRLRRGWPDRPASNERNSDDHWRFQQREPLALVRSDGKPLMPLKGAALDSFFLVRYIARYRVGIDFSGRVPQTSTLRLGLDGCGRS
jgi:hypothetical protein